MHQHEAAHRVFPTGGNIISRISDLVSSPTTFWKCPSDRRNADAGPRTSYLVNNGVVLEGQNSAVPIDDRLGNGFSGGPYFHSRDLKAAEVIDGLSQTAAFAERLLTPDSDQGWKEPELVADPVRYLWYLPMTYSSVDPFLSDCRSRRTTPFPFVFPTGGNVVGQGYNHLLGPNEVGCQSSSPSSGIGSLSFYAIPASSQHPGHVNLLLGDGAVRSVSNGIDLALWRAVGTRDGHENIGGF